MAKCDLCNKTVEAVELEHLNEPFRVGEVRDVCRACSKWCDDELWAIRGANAPELRRRIAARVDGTEPKKPFWKRIFSAVKSQPAWGAW